MKKGIFAQELEGYNLKEKAYVIGGTALGILAPIVAGKYLISGGIESHSLGGELFSWGASIVGNLLSFATFPATPIAYTTLWGMGLGTSGAVFSKIKRKTKKNIESRITKIEDSLNNSSNKNQSREELDKCERYLIHEGVYHLSTRTIKKYGNKLSKLTEKLNYIPDKLK